MKKPHSLKNILTIPLCAMSVIFITIIVVTSTLIVTQNAQEVTNKQINVSNGEILNNYENYFSSAISASDSIQESLANTDIKVDSIPVNSMLDNVKNVIREVSDISIYSYNSIDTTDNGKIIAYSSGFSGTNASEDDKWYTSAITNQQINNFSSIGEDGGGYTFFISKYFTFNKEADHGVLRITYDFGRVASSIAQSDLGEGGHITIFNNNYNVVYSSNSSFDSKELAIYKDLVIGSKEIFIDNVNYVLYISTISNTTWRVAILTNNNALIKTTNLYTFLLILFGAIAITLYILLVFGIAKTVTNPIAELQKEMERVELLNYSYKKQNFIKGSREVQELDKSFNAMMNRINELANKIVLEQKAQKESELKALQNQINPHFLYNTLDSIIYMINRNENDKAEKMIMALSKFFRISISNGKAIIPIKDEIEHAKNYLLIQKLRCGDSFTYYIDIDPQLYEYECVKLILQPIIENAIAHGIRNADDMEGKITIKGEFAGDLIRFDIIDDGFGMTEDKIEDIYNSFKDPTIHKGVGLQNVFLRIKMYYGDLANILITSELDSGTDISIFITKKDKIGDKNEK